MKTPCVSRLEAGRKGGERKKSLIAAPIEKVLCQWDLLFAILQQLCYTLPRYGDVAELADALALGASVLDVRVRVSPSPPLLTTKSRE